MTGEDDRRGMAEQPLDPKALAAGIARCWLLIVGLVVAGVAAGLGVAMVQRPVYRAQAVVVIPPGPTDTQGKPLRDMETQVRLATGADVLERAGAGLKPPLAAPAVAARISVAPVSADVLEIRSHASHPREAADLANAVAGAYVETSKAAVDQEAATELEGLEAEAGRLGSRIDELADAVATATGQLADAGPQTAEGLSLGSLAATLRGDATEQRRQLSEVNGQIADTKVTQSLRRDATRVLRPATPPGDSSGPRPVRDAALGGMAGLLAGLVAGLLTGVAIDRRRVRTRDDIAAAAGAPALASLQVTGRGVRTEGEASTLRQALAGLGATRGVPQTLVVVVQAGDRAGALLAAQLAGVASNDGLRTALVLTGRNPTLDWLRTTAVDTAADLSVRAAARLSTVQPLKGEDLVVAVVVAGGPVETLDWGRRGAIVLAVSAAFADADALAATTSAWKEAGQAVLGVLVADPEPGDRTTGMPSSGMPSAGMPSAGMPSAGMISSGMPGRGLGEPVPAVEAGARGRALASVQSPAAVPGPGPILDLPALMGALRRRRRLLAVTAAAGLVAGVMYSVALPPPHRARATVLLGHPAGTLPDRAIVTDIALAGTRPVAEAAAARLVPPVPAAELLGATHVAAASTELLEISVQGPSTPEAVRRARAVSEAFLDFRQDQFRTQWTQVADTLEERRQGLAAERDAIAEEVRGREVAAAEGGGVEGLGELQSRQAALIGQISIIDQQLNRGRNDLDSVVARTRIVEPAGALARSPAMAGAVNILIGLVLGLVFGTGWVVFREITDDRVRSGEDIMRLLRAPVALGLRRLPRPIRRFPGGAAARDLDRVVTHLYRTAGGGEDELPDRSLAVVSIGSDDATTALVIALATRLRDAGKAVLVADLGGGDDIARRLAERPEQVLTLPGDLPVCCVALAPLDTRVDLGLAGHGRTEAALRKKADLVLARASLQPAANAFQVAEWAGRAVVVVTAGRSVPATLRSDGQMLAAAGIDVDAVVVVGSDGDDHSAPGRRRPTPSSRAPATGTPRATRPG